MVLRVAAACASAFTLWGVIARWLVSVEAGMTISAGSYNTKSFGAVSPSLRSRAMRSGLIVLPERWPRVQFRVTNAARGRKTASSAWVRLNESQHEYDENQEPGRSLAAPESGSGLWFGHSDN